MDNLNSDLDLLENLSKKISDLIYNNEFNQISFLDAQRRLLIEKIQSGAADLNLSVKFHSPVTDHDSSDDCGVVILGHEKSPFWKDHKGAKLNAIRTRTLIERSALVIVRFGDQYKQWNAAFDAGYAAALGKAIVVLHDPNLTHPLKEVDAAALAVAESPEQVVKILAYVLSGTL